MKAKQKTILSAVVWAALLVLAALLVSFKLELVETQMAQTYYYGFAPIDDTLMYQSAVSVAEGDWLGSYSWKTLSKHMFFSVWLAWLYDMEVPYLVGGHLLYLVACVAAAWACAPLFRHKQWCAAVFAALWMSPYSWAQFTLRVYRDNIFPSLCLLFFAGALGMFLRFRQKPWRSVVFALLAGLGFGTAWLTREDGTWLLPFAGCATAAYLLLTALQKDMKLRQKLWRAALPVLSAAVGLVCIGLYCEQNYQHYGRFVVSDFTSKEFQDTIGALLRCETDGAHEQILVCKQTRDKVAAASPLYARLEQTITDNPALYGGYGSEEDREFNSGGFYWALRIVASETGYYTNARETRDFFAALAAEINEACDSGMLEHRGGKKSTIVMPWHAEYLQPTLEEFGNSVRCLLQFEQTTALAELSTPPPDQAAEMRAFLHTELSTVTGLDGTGVMYTASQIDAARRMAGITRYYRSAMVPALVLAMLGLFGWIFRAVREIRAKKIGFGAMAAILLLGVLLSVLLRVGIASYMEAVSFQIGTYLMYLSPACPLLLLFGAAGAVCALEMAGGMIARLFARRKKAPRP